jgi:hypothetical protein
MQRTDSDASMQNVAVDHAGPIAGRTDDETLTQLARHNPYLTRISTTITEPASIATDFTFGPAPADDPYQRVIGRADDTGGLAAIAASALVVVVAAAVLTVLLVRHRRS